MADLFLRRISAFMIDFLLIVLYAAFLYLIMMVFFPDFVENQTGSTPVKMQIVGFITLTLPVFLYAYLTEKSPREATIGKRWMKLMVVSANPSKPRKIFLRNLLKYLPWEMAHTGVHWLFFNGNDKADLPIWVWMMLATPQVIVLLFFITIVIYKGQSSFYDRIANTRIILH